MGMTLWFGTRGDDAPQYDEVDRIHLLPCLDELDELCSKLNVTPLSAFVDDTEAAMDLTEPDENEELELEPPDASSMCWFDPQDAVKTITALTKALKDNPTSLQSDETKSADALADLKDLLKPLKAAAKHNHPFHLAIIS